MPLPEGIIPTGAPVHYESCTRAPSGMRELNRAKVRVAAGAQPWLAGWIRLTANRHAQSTWKANPQATVARGGTGQNYTILFNDIHAAYQNALRWKVAGTGAHGDAARDILNAWSATLTTVTGNADRFLAAGIYGYQFANAGELMRGYPGFGLARFQRMLREVFYPLNHQFLTQHNGACITNYWANWDLCSMVSVMAIGILCDDTAKYDQAVNYFKNGAGNGSIKKAVPFLHPGGLAQWQESGRDQGHTMMGMGLMGAVCEMAWSQGDDLYGYDETVISAHGRGQVRPVWDLLHYHYARRRRLSVPYITAIAEKVRPEGGGGDYGPNSGGYDQLGFGTLMYAK